MKWVKYIFLLSILNCFGFSVYADEGIITTVAGNGTAGFSGDGGLAINAQLNSPSGIAIDDNDNLYIADTKNHRIRKVDTFGNIYTIAGDGSIDETAHHYNYTFDGKFGGDDGLAVNAQLNHPQAIAIDKIGNFYIADTGNHRIRKIDTSGNISTVAGNGNRMGAIYFPSSDNNNSNDISINSTDGSLATTIPLNSPENLAIDNNGNLYIAVLWHHTVYRVDTSGNIFTVAGTTEGFSGDGGLATQAQLGSYLSIALDSNNIYISDGSNDRIRKIDGSGIITTVIGGGYVLGDGGSAAKAQLNFPLSITIDTSGNFYIADAANHRIRRVDNTGIITTIAGNGFTDAEGNGGFSGDGGLATDAQLNFPTSVVTDSSGNLYIADIKNNRVRKVTFNNTSSVNQPPVAHYHFSANRGQAPLIVTLNADLSYDIDGSIVNYLWLVDRQTIAGKIVSVTLEKAGDYPIILTVTDDKGATDGKIGTIVVTQSIETTGQFCTSGSVNINNISTNCSNGDCIPSGVKITCNSEICQWCDANESCGNIQYDGITPIPNGSTNCNKGQCTYNIQNGGSSSSSNFNCKSDGNATVNKIKSVSPTVSQPLYYDGDTINVTIPPVEFAGQSQYFGVNLPDNLGLFVADSLNKFQPFNESNIPEWNGGEVAVDMPVTEDLPRGKYDAHLLRSLKGLNPLKTNVNQSALGTSSFMIIDQVKVMQITDPSIELGFVGTTGKETIGIFGTKDQEGRLTDINHIFFGSQTDKERGVNIVLNSDYLPNKMELLDGSQVEFSDYTDTGATVIYRRSDGSVGKQTTIPLSMSKLHKAAESIKNYINSPQLSRNNPIPSKAGTVVSPTNDNCLVVMDAYLKLVDALFTGVFMIASVASCEVAIITASLPGILWTCGSVILNSVDKISDMITNGHSPFKALKEKNDYAQGSVSCLSRDWVGCAQFVAESAIGTVIETLTPEIMCPQAESCPKNIALYNWCNKQEMNASKYWFEGVETCQVSPLMSSIFVDESFMESLFDELRNQCNSMDSEADVAEGWNSFNCNSKKGSCK